MTQMTAIALGDWVINGSAGDIYGWLRASHPYLPPPLRDEFEQQLFGKVLSPVEQRNILEGAQPKRARLTRN